MLNNDDRSLNVVAASYAFKGISSDMVYAAAQATFACGNYDMGVTLAVLGQKIDAHNEYEVRRYQAKARDAQSILDSLDSDDDE